MAMRLTKAEGLCCECEDQTGCACQVIIPTECRHTGGILTIATTPSCSTRGGTATLCGHSEYEPPSVPPRKYRRKTFSGRVKSRNFDSSGCTGSSYTITDTYSGAEVFNRDTCAFSSTAQQVRVDDRLGVSTFSISEIGLFGACGDTAQLTPTTRRIIGFSGCCVFGGFSLLRIEDSAEERLDLADTEADARARAGLSGWSAYVPCPTGLPCCEASASARSAGEFTFDFTEARFRASYSGALDGTQLRIYVTFYFRDLVTLATGDYGVSALTTTADASGEGVVDVDVPQPPSGYAYGVSELRYEIRDLGSAAPPESWPECAAVGDSWAGQLYIAATGDLAYNLVQHRALWPEATAGVTRTARLFWESTDYGAGAWAPDGYTDVAITGVALPALSWSDWINVPNEEGVQRRLMRAELRPPGS